MAAAQSFKQILKNKWSLIALLIVIVLLILIIRPFLVTEGYNRPTSCRYDNNHRPNVDDYYYRRRVAFEGKDPYWQCQLGWQDTGCDWSDGREYGNKQCRRPKTQAGKAGGYGHSSSVFLYTEINYGGDKLEVKAGEYIGNLKDKNFNDKARSMKVPQGVEVTIWNDTDARGEYWAISGPAYIADLEEYCMNPEGGEKCGPIPFDFSANDPALKRWYRKYRKDGIKYDGISSIEVKVFKGSIIDLG